MGILEKGLLLQQKPISREPLTMHFYPMLEKASSITREEYFAPSVRIIVIDNEAPFLQSNLEPIDGGDDPFIDW